MKIIVEIEPEEAVLEAHLDRVELAKRRYFDNPLAYDQFACARTEILEEEELGFRRCSNMGFN